jgi:hypothetical protein
MTLHGIERYSDVSGITRDFLAFVKENHFDRPELYDVNTGIKNCKLQYWPTFMGSALSDQLGRLTASLFGLIKAVPATLFDLDHAAIGSFFGFSPEVVRMQLANLDPQYLDLMIGRGDYVLTAGGFKCVEVNLSANIGGMWEVLALEQKYLRNPVIRLFLARQGLAPRAGRTIGDFFDFLLDVYRQQSGGDHCHVVYAVAAGRSTGMTEKLNAYLKELARENENMKCLSFSIADYYDLRTAHGELFCNGKKVDLLIENYAGAVPDELLTLHRQGKFILIGGPITTLLANKFNLALLSEFKDRFSPQEAALIERHIPWTRKIENRYVEFENRRYWLKDLLLEQRRRLVIKPVNLSGGTSVLIGRDTPPEQWRQAAELALLQGKWIVQAFAPSVYYDYLGDGGVIADSIGGWGNFVFGNKLSGNVFLLHTNTEQHVFNLTKGGSLSCVFEVAEQPATIE